MRALTHKFSEFFGAMVGGLFATAVALEASPASAMEKFPVELTKVFERLADSVGCPQGPQGGALCIQEMPCVPQCTLCHETPRGGKGTVSRKFGQTLQGYGLDPGDLDSVERAIGQDIADGVDSDRDGVADYQELMDGTNPSEPDEDAPLCGPDSGCFARVAPHAAGEGDGTAAVAAVTAALALIAASRRRRRSNR